MKIIAETELEISAVDHNDTDEQTPITKASRLAFDDGGLVKYAAEVELADGQIVGYSRADSGDFDAGELAAAMLGVIEATTTTGEGSE